MNYVSIEKQNTSVIVFVRIKFLWQSINTNDFWYKCNEKSIQIEIVFHQFIYRILSKELRNA